MENINRTITQKLHYNQWRNTSNVIDWFQNIVEKVNCIFINCLIWELVGLCILSILGIQNVSLYQDDGLASLHKISGPTLEKIRKDIVETFWENFGLKITITTKVVNFLNGTLDLCTGRYQPYKKSNDIPTYFSVNSNHKPNIIKALPDSISKRISNISSDKATFSNTATFYNDALSGRVDTRKILLIKKICRLQFK